MEKQDEEKYFLRNCDTCDQRVNKTCTQPYWFLHDVISGLRECMRYTKSKDHEI